MKRSSPIVPARRESEVNTCSIGTFPEIHLEKVITYHPSPAGKWGEHMLFRYFLTGLSRKGHHLSSQLSGKVRWTHALQVLSHRFTMKRSSPLFTRPGGDLLWVMLFRFGIPIAQIEQYFVSRDTFRDIRKYFFVKRESWSVLRIESEIKVDDYNLLLL